MALYYSASSTLQVMPVGQTDPGTYYIAMQPTTNGRTNAVYAGGAATYNAATGTLTSTTLSTNTLNVGGAIYASGNPGTSGQFLSSTGAGLQWVTLSASSISNGTSNVRIASSGGSITMGAGNGPGLTFDAAGNLTIGGNLIVQGTTTTVQNEVSTGNFTPSANLTYNIGNSTNWWNIIYGNTFQGRSTTALYADLAENYQADRFYNPGTVVMFGGAAEVTLADADTTRVAGVVSTNPAHLMNGQLSGSSVVPIALQGRVPCQVIGPVAKGDLMVSAGFGFAKVNNTPAVGTVIGKALEDFGIQAKGIIEVVVGRF